MVQREKCQDHASNLAYRQQIAFHLHFLVTSRLTTKELIDKKKIIGKPETAGVASLASRQWTFYGEDFTTRQLSTPR